MEIIARASVALAAVIYCATSTKEDHVLDK